MVHTRRQKHTIMGVGQDYHAWSLSVGFYLFAIPFRSRVVHLCPLRGSNGRISCSFYKRASTRFGTIGFSRLRRIPGLCMAGRWHSVALICPPWDQGGEKGYAASQEHSIAALAPMHLHLLQSSLLQNYHAYLFDRVKTLISVLWWSHQSPFACDIIWARFRGLRSLI